MLQQHLPIVWFGRFDRPNTACVCSDGRVAGIAVAAGSQVAEGAKLMTIESVGQ